MHDNELIPFQGGVAT